MNNRRTPLISPRKNAGWFQGPPAYMQNGRPFFSIYLTAETEARFVTLPLWIAQGAPNLSQCAVRGAWTTNALVLFWRFVLKKERPLLVAWQRPLTALRGRLFVP